MYGPYDLRSDAREELAEQLGSQFSYDDLLRKFREACVRCEVGLGEFDDQVVRDTVQVNHPLNVQSLIAMIMRAYDAGCARGEAAVEFRNASTKTPGIFDLSEELGVHEG